MLLNFQLYGNLWSVHFMGAESCQTLIGSRLVTITSQRRMVCGLVVIRCNPENMPEFERSL